MLLFRALANNMAPMTNADESPTNRLTLFSCLPASLYSITDYYYTRCLSSPNICYKFLTCLRELTHSWRKISAMLLVSAIHAIQRKQCVYIVQSSCPSLTQAWPGRESDASVRHVVSKRNIRDIAKNHECNSWSEWKSNLRTQNREHKFTLRKHEDRHLV